eukprot:6183821-Pleurochrysis_carterae.AAC.1
MVAGERTAKISASRLRIGVRRELAANAFKFDVEVDGTEALVNVTNASAAFAKAAIASSVNATSDLVVSDLVELMLVVLSLENSLSGSVSAADTGQVGVANPARGSLVASIVAAAGDAQRNDVDFSDETLLDVELLSWLPRIQPFQGICVSDSQCAGPKNDEHNLGVCRNFHCDCPHGWLGTFCERQLMCVDRGPGRGWSADVCRLVTALGTAERVAC